MRVTQKKTRDRLRIRHYQYKGWCPVHIKRFSCSIKRTCAPHVEFNIDCIKRDFLNNLLLSAEQFLVCVINFFNLLSLNTLFNNIITYMSVNLYCLQL